LLQKEVKQLHIQAGRRHGSWHCKPWSI